VKLLEQQQGRQQQQPKLYQVPQQQMFQHALQRPQQMQMQNVKVSESVSMPPVTVAADAWAAASTPRLQLPYAHTQRMQDSGLPRYLV
jgi:hypothetical protein